MCIKNLRGEMKTKNWHKKLCVLYTLPDSFKISFLTIIMVFWGLSKSGLYFLTDRNEAETRIR